MEITMEDMELAIKMTDKLLAAMKKLEDFLNVRAELEHVNTATLHAIANRFVGQCARNRAPSSYRGRKSAIRDIMRYRGYTVRICLEDKVLSKIAV